MAAEQYLDQLNTYLKTLEELQQAYVVQNRLRDGVRAVGKAYIASAGPERDTALTNVRYVTINKDDVNVQCS